MLFQTKVQMREINLKIIEGAEKSLEELVSKNPQFFEKFKTEENQGAIKKALKDSQSFGNKDRQFKKELAAKWSDARLQQLQEVLLHDKKILDIGCNTGVIDILLAVRYQPKLIIGVDIDHHLVKQAIDNMQKVINDSEQMQILFDQVKKSGGSGDDQEMIAEYESLKKKQLAERENKLRDLLRRVELLPKSLQLAIQGELASLNNDQAKFV